MARPHGSWYFEGYESERQTDAGGRERNVLVYRGAWYGLGLDGPAYRRVKALFAALAAVMTAAYLLVSFFPSPGGMMPLVGGIGLLALVPMIFLWIGLVNFLASKPAWPVRVHYAGYRRMARWLPAQIVLLAVPAAAEVVYIFRAAGNAGRELPYLLGWLVSIGCAAAMVLLQRRYPVTVVRNPDVR